MKFFRRADWTIERTIRNGIVTISSTAVLLTASLAWKLAHDAGQETLREVTELSIETTQNRVANVVTRHIREFEQIASSNVIATALTDSSGREGYLAPFLEQRTQATGLTFAIFDYRGRMLIRTGGGSDVPAPPSWVKEATQVPDLDFSAGPDNVAFAAPIRFFADNKPIGFLTARIPPAVLAADSDLLSSKFFTAKVSFYTTETYEPQPLHVKISDTGKKVLAARIELEPQMSWLDATLQKMTTLGILATITILMSGLLMARWSAHLIASPIRELTQAVKQLREGHDVSAPKGEMPVEINTLSAALFLAFEERGAALNKLQNLAHYDSLTGTLSRAYFDHQARNMLQIAARNDATATLVYLDLDRFKAINDTYGHDAGDILLTTITTRIQRRLRTNDLIGRRGGDEFVLLLSPLGDHGDIGTLAYDLSRMITMPVDIGNGISVSVGVSMGAATYPDDSQNYNDLVTLADQAMYESKKFGRGRMTFASGPTVPLASQDWTASTD